MSLVSIAGGFPKGISKMVKNELGLAVNEAIKEFKADSPDIVNLHLESRAHFTNAMKHSPDNLKGAVKSFMSKIYNLAKGDMIGDL